MINGKVIERREKKRKIKRFLQLHKRKFLSKEIYGRICYVGPQRPRIYGLPKVHKPNIPLRPILSMYGSIQCEEAKKWLVEILDPVLKFYSSCCVPDFFQFASMICQLSSCAKTEFLSYFEIPSSFTNITLDETISICADYLY